MHARLGRCLHRRARHRRLSGEHPAHSSRRCADSCAGARPTSACIPGPHCAPVGSGAWCAHLHDCRVCGGHGRRRRRRRRRPRAVPLRGALRRWAGRASARSLAATGLGSAACCRTRAAAAVQLFAAAQLHIAARPPVRLLAAARGRAAAGRRGALPSARAGRPAPQPRRVRARRRRRERPWAPARRLPVGGRYVAWRHPQRPSKPRVGAPARRRLRETATGGQGVSRYCQPVTSRQGQVARCLACQSTEGRSRDRHTQRRVPAPARRPVQGASARGRAVGVPA